MSESLTRTAALEDCLNLMNASESICEAFKEVSGEHRTFAQFGSLTRADDRLAVELLDLYKNDWASHRTVKEEVGFRSAPLVPKTQAESSLALALGWICSRAVEAHLTPESAEAALYRDAELFRKLYVREASVSRQELAELFSVLQQRFFIEMHTYVPDVDDIEGWFDRLDVTIREWEAHMDRLAGAVADPDPALVQRYVTDADFYDEGDALIRLAQSARDGGKIPQDELAAALGEEPRSAYARALKQALLSLHSASVFFTGRIDRSSLVELLAV